MTPHWVETIQVTHELGGDFSLLIDGEEFPYFVTGVAASPIDAKSSVMPGVTITIEASRVSFITAIKPKAAPPGRYPRRESTSRVTA